MNPVPEHDASVQISDLKLAAREDLNRLKEGIPMKAIGRVIWFNAGTGKNPMLFRTRITGDPYQSAWIRDLLGRRIYVRPER